MVWTPRRTLVSDKILEETGVLGDVNVEAFPMFLIPLDRDILSMCLEDSFGDIYLVCLFTSPLSLLSHHVAEGYYDDIFSSASSHADAAHIRSIPENCW